MIIHHMLSYGRHEYWSLPSLLVDSRLGNFRALWESLGGSIIEINHEQLFSSNDTGGVCWWSQVRVATNGGEGNSELLNCAWVLTAYGPNHSCTSGDISSPLEMSASSTLKTVKLPWFYARWLLKDDNEVGRLPQKYFWKSANGRGMTNKSRAGHLRFITFI